MRRVVRPFEKSTNACRIRNCDCSSPNGGTPLKAPKKSASMVALGAHFPMAGGALKVKLMRVFRTSPSKIPWGTPGWARAAHSAFCPLPKLPAKDPRSLNKLALTNPLIVSVSPSASLTTCCAVAARAPRIKTPATASVENDAIRVRMTPPRVKSGYRALQPGAPEPARSVSIIPSPLPS